MENRLDFFILAVLEIRQVKGCVSAKCVFFSVLLLNRTLSYTDVNTVKRSQVLHIHFLAQKIKSIYINDTFFLKQKEVKRQVNL